MGEKLLTLDDLAARWSLEVSTLRRWRREGRLPTEIRLGGTNVKGVRFRLDDVIACEDRLKQGEAK